MSPSLWPFQTGIGLGLSCSDRWLGTQISDAIGIVGAHIYAPRTDPEPGTWWDCGSTQR